MITLYFERDQARHIQQKWFPFLHEYCDMKVRDAILEHELFEAILTRSIYKRITLMFYRILRTKGNRLSFSWFDDYGIVFYNLIRKVPIDNSNFFENKLQGDLILEICSQLIPDE